MVALSRLLISFLSLYGLTSRNARRGRPAPIMIGRSGLT
jgi:hypothetical protein